MAGETRRRKATAAHRRSVCGHGLVRRVLELDGKTAVLECRHGVEQPPLTCVDVLVSTRPRMIHWPEDQHSRGGSLPPSSAARDIGGVGGSREPGHILSEWV